MIDSTSTDVVNEKTKLEVLYDSIISTHDVSLLSKIDLSNCNLCEFPIVELKCISANVTSLNFGGNRISSLPDELILFQQLRILFFANNSFDSIPEVLSNLKSLYMVSFKSNKLKEISETCLSSSIEWLILTDNELTSLPLSIGSLTKLRKCMLAGNKLSFLPTTMKHCQKLELIRLAANNFTDFPDWLYELPRLSWIAFGGNPVSTILSTNDNIDIIHWNEIKLYEKLGEGASGVVHKGIWKKDNTEILVAIKLFKGVATSDGLPEDEMKASIHQGNHPNSSKVYGKLIDCPMGLGLVLELIDPSFKILGLPPSFDTITRDTYPEDKKLDLDHVISVAKGVVSVCSHLHSRGISHGDLYAHNILVDDKGESLLSDFGAASFYDPSSLHASSIEGFEVRAFGCLLEELIQLAFKSAEQFDDKSREAIVKLQDIQMNCMKENPLSRPTFNSIIANLAQM